MLVDLDRCRELLYEPEIRAAMLAASAAVVGVDEAHGPVHDAILSLSASFRRNPREVENPKAYFAVTTRRAATTYRSAARRDQPTDSIGDQPDPFETPAELRLSLKKCLDELEDPLRAVVDLHYLVGMTIAEVASGLGVREGTVRGRITRARERLRACLEAEGWS